MLRLVDEAFGMPLDGGEEGKRRVFETFNHTVGGGGDDAQAAAEAVGGLFVITVDGNFGLADRSAEARGEVKGDVMSGKLVADLTMLQGIWAGQIGEELMDASTAVDVHQLRAEANAEGGQPAAFDFGEEGQLEFLAGGVDAHGFGMPGLAVEGGVEIVSAGEEETVAGIDELGDEGEIAPVPPQGG